MTNITRRAALSGFASLPAIAGATALPVALVAAETFSDPLADLIAEYRAKTAEFEAIPYEVLMRENEDALVEATYRPTAPADRGKDHAVEALIALSLAYLDGGRS